VSRGRGVNVLRLWDAKNVSWASPIKASGGLKKKKKKKGREAFEGGDARRQRRERGVLVVGSRFNGERDAKGLWEEGCPPLKDKRLTDKKKRRRSG